MKHLIKRYFSSKQKYFLDNTYQNIEIQTKNKFNDISSITHILKQSNVPITYINSHFVHPYLSSKKYFLDLSIQKQNQQKLNQLKNKFSQIGVIFKLKSPIKVPWFPRQFQDLNLIGKILLDVKDTENRDHPQFIDQQYRKRRNYIAQVALQSDITKPIPNIQYTKEQSNLWTKIFAKLQALHAHGMSKRFNKQMQKLNKQFKFSQRIPQLNQLSQYLKSQTGFTIKPVHGILSQRQFFESFAFRVFCSTQYLRNVATPDYTPQPDIVHEILGHIPLLADPQVANLSQQIGLLILGASDQQISQIGSLYWFTLQFGACVQNGKKLGYGAGIASSISQISHLMSTNAKFSNFQPLVDCHATYPIQTVQDVYRITQSFQKAMVDLQQFGKTLNKPIQTTYNSQTKTVQYQRNIEGIDHKDIPINI